MSKKTPIKVHVWPTKHKGNDIWKVAIDDVGGGPLTELKERYTRKHNAKRGGARKVGASLWPSLTSRSGWEWMTEEDRPVTFIYAKPTKP